MNQRRTSLLAIACLAALAAPTPTLATEPAWPAKVVKLVAANYSYPRSAELLGEEGRAIVKITISGTGKPVSVELMQSSGSRILDREAVRIPMKVGMFPAPPGGVNAVITVPIKWQAKLTE